jgi:chemotaxis signal transduction protein
MPQATGTESFILFEVAGTTYGVRSGVVQQVQMIEHVTPVPNAISVVEGVVHSRGRVIPALNLRVRFGFQRIPFDMRARLVVINIRGRLVGLVVDTAREFVFIPDASIEVPPEGITKLSGKYLDGIATIKERLILILNIEQVIDVNGLEEMAAELPS